VRPTGLRFHALVCHRTLLQRCTRADVRPAVYYRTSRKIISRHIGQWHARGDRHALSLIRRWNCLRDQWTDERLPHWYAALNLASTWCSEEKFLGAPRFLESYLSFPMRACRIGRRMWDRRGRVDSIARLSLQFARSASICLTRTWSCTPIALYVSVSISWRRWLEPKLDKHDRGDNVCEWATISSSCIYIRTCGNCV